MLSKRRHPRFTKRLETTFSSSGSKYRGITSDLSAEGIFIRTQHGLTPGSEIDIEVYLPDQTICRLKGIVRRTVKTAFSVLKNGMGVELIEKDPNYAVFLGSFKSETGTLQEPAPETPIGDLQGQPDKKETGTPGKRVNGESRAAGHQILEPIIVTCAACKTKNRVRRETLALSPRCGKCNALLELS